MNCITARRKHLMFENAFFETVLTNGSFCSLIQRWARSIGADDCLYLKHWDLHHSLITAHFSQTRPVRSTTITYIYYVQGKYPSKNCFFSWIEFYLLKSCNQFHIHLYQSLVHFPWAFNHNILSFSVNFTLLTFSIKFMGFEQLLFLGGQKWVIKKRD